MRIPHKKPRACTLLFPPPGFLETVSYHGFDQSIRQNRSRSYRGWSWNRRLGRGDNTSQKGHHVTILERHPFLNEFGASIGIQANGVRCLKAWGFEKDFEPFISPESLWEICDGLTGDRIGHLPSNKSKYSSIEFGDEIWNLNRKDHQDILAKGATRAGVKIIFGVDLVEIDVDECIATTKDGGKFKADIIIGADGMARFVRSQIPAVSHVEPVALVNEQCWRCSAPKGPIRQSPRLKHLLGEPHEITWTAPGRYILNWPLVESRDYDIVLCLQENGDIPPGRWGTVVDPEDGIKYFQAFCPLVMELLSHVKTAVKWTLGEVPPLETCKSKNGRVLLVRDAFHAMIPHSASGGSSAMEDAACVGECLDWAWQKHKQGTDLDTAISIAAKAYEDIQKPRVERMQTASHEAYGVLGGSDPAFLPIRDQSLKETTKDYDNYLALSEQLRRSKPKVAPDMNVRFPLDPFRQWLHGYDATATTKDHLAQLNI